MDGKPSDDDVPNTNIYPTLPNKRFNDFILNDFIFFWADQSSRADHETTCTSSGNNNFFTNHFIIRPTKIMNWVDENWACFRKYYVCNFKIKIQRIKPTFNTEKTKILWSELRKGLNFFLIMIPKAINFHAVFVLVLVFSILFSDCLCATWAQFISNS